ncbi:Ubiquitin carboxyl-terminal hydrolase 23 [Echinococcus granulosus]|uniref:Ubiquitin carboxyl-terminal hydrolase 36 n=1 Tax=Echinococcus granulosus TaxID=6210 RepID=A0A068WRP5_ECHGR|nr:Ubiquitin carboxyl-terminal hydrolase 23 [Echinococcus granulosus]CDS22490.1 ubiquitin carboxyl terminal hydrolase 23 [Echinococcus granulosus]
MASARDKSDSFLSDLDTKTIELLRNPHSALPLLNMGLQNYGSNCFIDAVLQILLATGPMLSYLHRQHSNPDSCANTRHQVFCGLCALHRLYRAHHLANIMDKGANEEFVYSVSMVSESLQFNRHEDAHEYLLALLNLMARNADIAELEKSPTSSNHNIIRKLFGGQTVTKVPCSVCSTSSQSYDHWLNLSLDISKSDSLQESLARYMEEEVLCDGNEYVCSVCQQSQSATRLTRIHQAPPILIVQLNRFTPRNDKLDYHVDFPLLFGMTPHMADSSGPPVRYRLYPTINHRGGHSQCGHYVAFTRRRYNLWYCHNDDTVRAPPFTPLFCFINNLVLTSDFLALCAMQLDDSTETAPRSATIALHLVLPKSDGRHCGGPLEHKRMLTYTPTMHD